MPAPEIKEIFRGSKYRVVHYVPKVQSSVMPVITFNSWSKVPSIERPPFASGFLQAMNAEFVAIISAENCWFQYKEIEQAIQATARELRGRECLGYGSSMGGYGIMNFSKMLNIVGGLSLVPQYSIDRAKVPFETRWKKESSQFSFENENIHNGNCSGQFSCAYDAQHHMDVKHIELLQNKFPDMEKVAIAGASHNLAAYLSDQGMLKHFVKYHLFGIE